jgi:hypothetical protein
MNMGGLRGVTVVMLLGACGDNLPAHVDAGAQADASRDATVCEVKPSYAPTQTLTMQARNGLQSGTTRRRLIWVDVLSSTNPPDAIWIELYEGYGVFETTRLATGTYELIGAEANYASCGVCVTLSAKLNTTTFEAAEDYIAIGGTLAVTSLDPFQGTLSNAQFQHIMFTNEGQQVINDGCTTSIAALSFNAPVVTNPPYTGNAVVSWSVNGANDGSKCPTGVGTVKVDVLNASDVVVATTDPSSPACNASPATVRLDNVAVGTYKVRATLTDPNTTTTYTAEQASVVISAYNDTAVSLDITCAGCPQ